MTFKGSNQQIENYNYRTFPYKFMTEKLWDEI